MRQGADERCIYEPVCTQTDLSHITRQCKNVSIDVAIQDDDEGYASLNSNDTTAEKLFKNVEILKYCALHLKRLHLIGLGQKLHTVSLAKK